MEKVKEDNITEENKTEEIESKEVKQEKPRTKKKKIYPFFKRLMDFFISLIAILVLSPIFIIVYLLSLIILKGNPIFVQYRPGKNNKIFPMYKFRSMTNKKDKEGNLLPDKDRITTWGKILRKTSLDELPQLFNILAGHMSIVGPRPRLIKDTIFYDKKVLDANTVRPGLTGPAQVYDRNSEYSWDEVFKRDLEYVEKMSFCHDVKLFFGTFLAVFKGGSSSGAEENVKKREYYYPDHLLKANEITKEQYDLGLSEAENIIRNKTKYIEFMPSLHVGVDEGKEKETKNNADETGTNTANVG